ncbi:MAG: hypothetical protein ACK5NA_04445 [Enterococcus sp.]
MYTNDYFQEIGLTLVELPIEFIEDKLTYRGYLKELPTISAEGSSRQEMYTKLLEIYSAYREQLVEEASDTSAETQETTSTLSVDQLMRYYDGETFDGFKIEETTDDPDCGKGWY